MLLNQTEQGRLKMPKEEDREQSDMHLAALKKKE
jgi:hypothetical protein